MKVSYLFLNNAKIIITLVLLSTLSGGGLAAAINPGALLNQEWSIWKNTSSGLLNGFLIGAISIYFELAVFASRLRKMPFFVAMSVRSIFYVGTIVIIEVLVSYLYLNTTWAAFSEQISEALLNGRYLLAMFGAVVAIGMINFLFTINRMLGQKVLWRYLTGRYHRPVEEERIFMFLDVKHSTKIAERIGHVRFHSFLSELYYDVTKPIIESDGEIYKYVGDEVIVTWKLKNGLRNENCIRCYFNVAEKLKRLRPKYKKKYGFVPDFRCGIHYGTVVAGELGDYKKEIGFLGDVVNTTSRILEECKTQKTDFLISTELLERIGRPENVKFVHLGEIRLRGKENTIQLSSIET